MQSTIVDTGLLCGAIAGRHTRKYTSKINLVASAHVQAHTLTTTVCCRQPIENIHSRFHVSTNYAAHSPQ